MPSTRCRTSAFAALLIASALLTASPSSLAASKVRACPGALDTPSAAEVEQARMTMLCLINNERIKRGRRPLRVNPRLQAAADRHSHDMARRHYFSHVTPGGVDPVARLKAIGYATVRSAWAVAENIAWGSGRLAQPASVVGMWMLSPGHRRNILDPLYREIGIGIAPGAPAPSDGYEAATYTTNFGRRG